MHSKKKGNIGQFGVGLALSRLGYSIFTEEGDISKIDLIAEKNNKLLRIQCKAITPKDGKIMVPLKKSGPYYQFNYNSKMFDYFGIYLLGDEKTPTFSEGKSLVAKQVSDSERVCDQTSLG